MQAISFYLYPNLVDAYLSVTGLESERYRRVYNRNLKIYRGVDNRIDLQVRNSDQKATTIANYSPVLNLVSRETQKLVLKKDAVSMEDSTAYAGRCYVMLTADELENLDPGFYQYAVTLETRTAGNEYAVTERLPLFIDSQYGVNGTIEIIGSPTGELQDTFEVKDFAEYIPLEDPTYYISELIDAKPEVGSASGLHTLQYNMTNYTGEVILQASQSNGATPEIWIDLETLNFTSESIFYHNVVGKYNWFRIKHTPAEGTIDSILYR